MIHPSHSDSDLGAGAARAEIVMQDGVVLVTDIWCCAHARAAPVVLERTPYGRKHTDQAERVAGATDPLARFEVARLYHQAGLHYAVQDCRGTGASGGSFRKYLQERSDTLATLNWLRLQHWCDGRIAMVGFSYGAACQLAAMADTDVAPDVAVLDCGGFSDALTSGIRQGGALLLKQATWALAQAARDARAEGNAPLARRLDTIDVLAWLRRGPIGCPGSPLAAAPQHEANLADMWRHGMEGPFWDRPGLRTPAAALGRTPTRALLVTSWYDTSLIGTLENFQALTAPGASCPEPALIIGPWTHGDRWTQINGDADFGIGCLPETRFGVSFPELRRDYVKSALFDEKSPLDGVHYFEIGGGRQKSPGGRWKHDRVWPPENARDAELFLDGPELTGKAPVSGKRTFLADPRNPVPTLGGAINSGGTIMPGGMWDHSGIAPRDDVLSYRTPVFRHRWTLAGPVRADIWIATDVPDLDVAAKLLLVLEDGRAFNISDGLCRARHREGLSQELFLTPNEATQISVRLNPIALCVLPGQALRLDVAASNFPCFDINPQTGAPQGQPGPSRVARVTVLTGAAHCSSLHVMKVPE